MNQLSRPFLISSLVVSVIILCPLILPFFTHFQINSGDISSPVWSVRYYRSVTNSFIIAIAVSGGACLLGSIQAIFLERVRLFGKPFWRWLYLMPLLIPPYIHTVAWIRFVDILKKADFFSESVMAVVHSFLFSRCGVIFILTIICTPVVTAIVSTGLRTVDTKQEEAALLTASPAKVVWKISIPQVVPHLLTSSLIVMLLCLNNFDVPDLLRVHVIPAEVFIQLSAMYEERVAFLVALPLVGTAIVVTCIIRLFLRNTKLTGAFNPNKKGFRLEGKTAECTGLIFMVSLYTTVVLLPLTVLCVTGASGVHIFRTLFSSIEQINYSLFLSAGTAALSVIISIPLAYLLARKLALHWFFELILILAFAVPAVLYSLGLIRIFGYLPFDSFIFSSLPCVLGLIAHFLFLGVKVIQVGLLQISPRNEEAACLTQKSWIKIVWVVILPRIAPFMSAVFFLIFMLCIGELSATLLLVPPGRETVAVKIYNLMHYGAYDQVASLSLLISLIIILAFTLTRICLRWVTKQC